MRLNSVKIVYSAEENWKVRKVFLTRKPMGLKFNPLKTSFLAAVQVLALKVGENDKK